MNHHVILTDAEQQAVINALEFYNDFHTTTVQDDDFDQYCMAFVEDNGGDSTQGVIDKLTTKIATTN